jgi:hypothetical protein
MSRKALTAPGGGEHQLQPKAAAQPTDSLGREITQADGTDGSSKMNQGRSDDAHRSLLVIEARDQLLLDALGNLW